MPIVEKQPRPDKVQEVAELKEVIASSGLILTDYQGLDVKSLSGLRRKIREAGGGYRIVKNNLLILAAQGTEVLPLTEGLAGPTAIVYTDDPVAAAKALAAYGKEVKPVKIKSGMVDGQLYSAEQVAELAKVPGKMELYAMVVGGLQSPISGLVGTLQQMIGQLVFTLQGVAEKKEAAA